MRRLGWMVAIACLVGAPRAWAGHEPAAPPPPTVGEDPPPTTVGPPSAPQVTVQPDPSLPAETEVTLDKATHLSAGIGFGGPIGAIASFRVMHGLGADVREEDGRVKAVCSLPIPHCAQGFTFQADAGSGGGKVSLGVGAKARVDEEDFHGTAGVGLRASLVRTWGSPIGTEPDLTYLGPELDLSIIRINLNLGVLWRVSGHAGPSALFSWGLGFGL
jgi:hypothetical protein